MLVADLVRVMQEIAPLEFAESWDKVGLLVGRQARVLSGPVVLTIDLTERVLDEAEALGASAIVAYHPPIWEPLARVTDATPRQRVILRALRADLAVYSPHTALDAVPGGVTDWLCEGLSGGTPGKVRGDVRALRPHAKTPQSESLKIVTFVPEADADRVRDALASAGAGIIGAYHRCSFSVAGLGTFEGAPGTKPATGQAGRFERTQEQRVEMVCARAALPIALETLRRFHPYEEPAIDVYELAPKPRRSAGPGRRLTLDKPVTVAELAHRLKTFIGRERARYALAGDTDRPVTSVGVVPGSGESLSRVARDEGCEVFVTGEMKHHEVLGALNAGMSVVLGGHTPTERGYLPRLCERLRAAGLDAKVSTEDRDPLVTV